MAEEPQAEIQARVSYAGFWRRAVAFYLDYVLVLVLAFPFVLIAGMVAPDHVVVSVPFGLFTQEKILSSDSNRENHADGSATAVERRLVEVRPLGLWTYVYEERIERLAGNVDETRTLVDPQTGVALQRTTTETITTTFLMIYWILLEAFRSKGSFGKQVMRIQVVDANGRRPGLGRAFFRNVSKVFSVLTLTIGFMMAGWTKRKQALHDLMTGSYVIVPAAHPISEGEERRIAKAS